MRKEALFLILFITIFSGIISATTIPIYVRPLLPNGSITPNTVYNYTLNWTTDNNCSNLAGVVYSNSNISVTTGSDGTAFFNVTIPNNITQIPSYMCEYRDGSLRATHQLTGQIFDRLYAQSLNISDQIYASGNITGSGGFFNSLGSVLSRIVNLFVANIDATGNINTLGNVSASYVLGNGKFLTGITATASPAGNNGAVQFNDAGATGGNESAFRFNKSSSAVEINGSLVVNGVNWSEGHGAIIASGGNENVSYIQYADGTMIEWGNASISTTFTVQNRNIGSYGWSYYFGSFDVTFPFSFASGTTPIVVANSGNDIFPSQASSPTNTGFHFSQLDYGPSTTMVADYIAIGRWTNLNLGTGSGGSGGIVNTITNANGTCSQWANGIMECYGNYSGSVAIQNSHYGGFRSGGQQITFPTDFSSIPSVYADSYGTSAFGATIDSQTIHYATIIFTAVTSQSAATRNAYWYAIGRWTNSTNVNSPDYSTWGLNSTNGDITTVNSSKNVLVQNDLKVSGSIYQGNAPIIESGSGSNGNWVKYADGTMICYNRESFTPSSMSAYGSIYYSNALTWNFPQAFTSAPIVNFNIEGGTGIYWQIGSSATASTTKAYTRVGSGTAATVAIDISEMAIGKWK